MTYPPSPPLGLPMVYLVDDEDVVRDALAWLLRSRRLLSEGFASADAIGRQRAKQAVQRRLAELTEREREVMHCVIDGRPNKLIADALNISVRTVEVHRARVFEKMDVKSAVELANVLRDHGGGAP